MQALHPNDSPSPTPQDYQSLERGSSPIITTSSPELNPSPDPTSLSNQEPLAHHPWSTHLNHSSTHQSLQTARPISIQNPIDSYHHSPEITSHPISQFAEEDTQTDTKDEKNHPSLESNRELQTPTDSITDSSSIQTFKLYKRRFLGLFILALLNLISAANAVLFTTSRSSSFYSFFKSI